MKNKICRDCNVAQRIENFWANSTHRDGYDNSCRCCRSSRAKDFRDSLSNKEYSEMLDKATLCKKKCQTKSLKNMGISNSKKVPFRLWMPEEEEFIKDKYLSYSYLELAISLDRTYYSVNGKIERMKLTKIFRNN